MHFFKTLLAGAALVASAVAQGKLAFTSFPSNVHVGSPVTVTWSGGALNTPVTITLRKGPSNNLKDVAVLTASATGTSFTWTPQSSLASGPDYALQITQGDQINYTGLFAISGGSGTLPSSSAATTTPATTPMTMTTPVITSSSSSSSIVVPTTTMSPPLSTGPQISRNTSTTIGRNSTISTPGLTSTRVPTFTPSSSSARPTVVPTSSPNGASVIMAAPGALLLGALAVFAYLN
ncbi:hypothetical protein LOZ58_002075 [Ophidiomyces ophidiicola]|nr:hypothetical protein LOZ65_004591 [Ophidiomyces ophidiicola]KAI1933913.1 hypothetical protein LOZ66_006235 [Ophidiomyces ophidiicola]KAI1963243.1 hypothetical protein LOZ58_002075 [Ophidiomyces ophidiicola]